MRRNTKKTKRTDDTEEGQEEQGEKGWRPPWYCWPLWIVADFDWRHKVRLQHRMPVQYYTAEPVPFITPIYAFPLQLLADGIIRFDNPQTGGRPPQIDTYKISNVFKIHFDKKYKEENSIKTKKPIVSSDGRYLVIRTLNGYVQAIITYENGLWLQWFEPTAEPGYFSLFLEGFVTYQEMGDSFLEGTLNVVIVLFAIVFFFVMMFSFLS